MRFIRVDLPEPEGPMRATNSPRWIWVLTCSRAWTLIWPRVKVLVSGIPAQEKLKVREFLMDANHGNAYAAWQKMGSPALPTAAQFVELQRAAVLRPVAGASTMKDGRAELPVTLERQGVILIELSW